MTAGLPRARRRGPPELLVQINLRQNLSKQTKDTRMPEQVVQKAEKWKLNTSEYASRQEILLCKWLSLCLNVYLRCNRARPESRPPDSRFRALSP